MFISKVARRASVSPYIKPVKNRPLRRDSVPAIRSRPKPISASRVRTTNSGHGILAPRVGKIVKSPPRRRISQLSKYLTKSSWKALQSPFGTPKCTDLSWTPKKRDFEETELEDEPRPVKKQCLSTLAPKVVHVRYLFKIENKKTRQKHTKEWRRMTREDRDADRPAWLVAEEVARRERIKQAKFATRSLRSEPHQVSNKTVEYSVDMEGVESTSTNEVEVPDETKSVVVQLDAHMNNVVPQYPPTPPATPITQAQKPIQGQDAQMQDVEEVAVTEKPSVAAAQAPASPPASPPASGQHGQSFRMGGMVTPEQLQAMLAQPTPEAKPTIVQTPPKPQPTPTIKRSPNQGQSFTMNGIIDPAELQKMMNPNSTAQMPQAYIPTPTPTRLAEQKMPQPTPKPVNHEKTQTKSADTVMRTDGDDVDGITDGMRRKTLKPMGGLSDSKWSSTPSVDIKAEALPQPKVVDTLSKPSSSVQPPRPSAPAQTKQSSSKVKSAPKVSDSEMKKSEPRSDNYLSKNKQGTEQKPKNSTTQDATANHAAHNTAPVRSKFHYFEQDPVKQWKWLYENDYHLLIPTIDASQTPLASIWPPPMPSMAVLEKLWHRAQQDSISKVLKDTRAETDLANSMKGCGI